MHHYNVTPSSRIDLNIHVEPRSKYYNIKVKKLGSFSLSEVLYFASEGRFTLRLCCSCTQLRINFTKILPQNLHTDSRRIHWKHRQER